MCQLLIFILILAAITLIRQKKGSEPKLEDDFNDFLSRNGFESFAPTFLSAGVTSFDLLGEKSEEEVLEIMGGKKIQLRKMYGGPPPRPPPLQTPRLV